MLIVADDLTGACDAAVTFATRIGQTVVLTASAQPMEACRVLSVSTESRDLDEPAILERMLAVADLAAEAEIVFKKIDSTLRGNVPVEVNAAMRAFGCSRAIVTPAFPDMGRIVKGGHLHIHGVPDRHAADCLDATTNEDLDCIVEAGLRDPGRVLWAGSAGLAQALARRLYGERKPSQTPPIDGQMIFCIGSDHAATLAQQSELRRHRPGNKIVPIQRGQTTAREIREAVAGAGALFITGGDTATVVLQAVGAKSIAVQDEVVTGVPWGVMSGGIFDGCPVVTKSGGFGAPDTLVRVADFFPCRI